jgi:hypothetical protein
LAEKFLRSIDSTISFSHPQQIGMWMTERAIAAQNREQVRDK